MPNIVIALNNTAASDSCARCGDPVYPAVGPELFLAHTWQPICRTCARREAPVLAALLEAYEALERAASAEYDDVPF